MKKLIFSIGLEEKVCHPKPKPRCLSEQQAREWGVILPEWFKVLPFNGITIFSIGLEQKVCHPKPKPRCRSEQQAREWGVILPEWFKVLPFNGITLKHMKKMKNILNSTPNKKKHREGLRQ